MPGDNIVINAHLGAVIVTTHARERWAERGQDGTLEDSLKRALPFGGQFGGNTLLADGDVVFATEQGRFGRVVKTVLAKDQAIVNMESRLINRPHSSKPVPNAGVPSAESGKPSRKNMALTDEALRKVCALSSLSYEDLILESQGASGRWLHLVNRELDMRNRVKNSIAQRTDQGREMFLVEQALSELLPKDQLERLWQRVESLRQGSL